MTNIDRIQKILLELGILEQGVDHTDMKLYTIGQWINDKEDNLLPKFGQNEKILRFVDVILKEAIFARVNKIEFECLPEGEAITRFKRGGVILNKKNLTDYLPVLNRLKIISCLDITENRIPQRYEPIKIILRIPHIECKSLMETFPGDLGESSRLTLTYNESQLNYDT